MNPRIVLVVALVAASVCSAESALDLREVDRVAVSPRSGAIVLHHDDIEVGHGPGAFVLRRTYAPQRGMLQDFGSNWATCFGVRAVVHPGGGFVRTPSGAFVELEPLDATTWVSTRGALWVDASAPQQLTIYGLNGRAYVCDSRGLLVAVRTRHAEVRLERDGNGLVQSVKGSWGTLRCERVDGVLQALVLPSGERVSYARGEGGVLATVDTGSRRVSYGYDAGRRLASLADGAAEIEYDATGRALRISGPRVSTQTLDYRIGEDALEVVASRAGRVVTHRFDFGGRWAESVADGVTSRRTFDTRGNTQTIERGSRAVHVGRDARGRVISREQNGELTRVRYVAGTDARAEVTRGGERVRFVRDDAGRLTATVGPHSATRFSYDDQGRVTSRNNVAFSYSKGETLSEVADRKVRSTFDEDGQLEANTLANGNTKRFVRGANGLRFEERDASGRLIRAAEQNLRGRIVRVEGAHGQAQTLSYTAQGQLASLDTPGAAPVELRYDGQGRVTEVTDAQGTLVSYSYPAANTVVVEDAAAGTSTLTLDACGRVVAVARGETELTRVYNERGQLIARQTPAGRERFRYDAAGNLTQARNADGTLLRTFDEHGNLASVQDTQGVTLESSYDEAGRRTSLSAPWGTIRYTRDALGQLTAVTLPDGSVIRCELLSDGRRSAVHFPNGVSTHFTYEGALLTGQRTTSGERVLLERALSYDAEGRLIEVRDLEGSARYSYDAEGRVVEAQIDGAARRFSYDARGNRTDLGSFDAGNHMLTAGEGELSYDAWGRLSGAGGNRFCYDAEGRLATATLADGRELSWSFDHAGRRTSRTLDGDTTRFVHDGKQLAGVFAADGASTAFVHGDRLDDTLAILRDGEWYFPLADQVQSLIGLTDSTGQLSGSASYAPFGATLNSSLPEWSVLGFAGRPLDRELGWVDMRARHYAPELARFVTPDPIGLRGGVNVYAYVAGNPLSFNDPRGTTENDPTQAEIEEEARRSYELLLSELPDWVEEEARKSGLDPLVGGVVLAQYAESQGWISEDRKAQIQTIAIAVAQEKLGSFVPTPIDADDPDAVALNLVLTLGSMGLASTGVGVLIPVAVFAAGVGLDYAMDWEANYRPSDLEPGLVVRRPDGTFTSSLLRGQLFNSPAELQAAIRQAYDRDGDGRWDADFRVGELPDFEGEAAAQNAFRITTVLPDGSFISAHFPGVVFGPDDAAAFVAMIRRGEHLSHGVCDPSSTGDTRFLEGAALDRFLEYMRLNNSVSAAVAQAMGLELGILEEQLANGGASYSYTTTSFPTEKYASLQLMVEDAERAAQELISWESPGLSRASQPLPEGFEGPVAPPKLEGGHYSTPLISYTTFKTLPEAFAAMEKLYEVLEVRPVAPAAVPVDGQVVMTSDGTDARGNRGPHYESPRVPGTFATRAEVVMAYQAQPHIADD